MKENAPNVVGGVVGTVGRNRDSFLPPRSQIKLKEYHFPQPPASK